MRRSKKPPPKPKPHREPWTVVHRDDTTRVKYPFAGPVPDWFDEDHAHRLAAPATPDHRWVPITVADLAQHGGPGITYDQAMSRKAHTDG